MFEIGIVCPAVAWLFPVGTQMVGVSVAHEDELVELLGPMGILSLDGARAGDTVVVLWDVAELASEALREWLLELATMATLAPRDQWRGWRR